MSNDEAKFAICLYGGLDPNLTQESVSGDVRSFAGVDYSGRPHELSYPASLTHQEIVGTLVAVTKNRILRLREEELRLLAANLADTDAKRIRLRHSRLGVISQRIVAEYSSMAMLMDAAL
jgi:hypothetical protein